MSEGLIGIWWMKDGIIAGFREASSRGHVWDDWSDSNLEHWSEWDKIANKFGCTPEDEYFMIPRGRCQMNLKTGTGRILYGKETKPKELALIANWFQLKDFETVIDDHYRIAPDPEDFE